MTEMVSRRTSCRLCGGRSLTLVLPMKPSPIGDAFVSADKKDAPQPLFPLDLYQCQSCGHVQNLDVVNPECLFREYIFFTSSSAGLVEHFRNYADDVVREFGIKGGSLFVEIGSNDGTLLRFFKDKGLEVIGVDPAREIARLATDAGLPTLPEFFTSGLAKSIAADHGKAKLIVANNVYAHADQLGDLTDGIAALLDDDGVFVFEVSYLLDIIDKFLFDTVYHEHLSYHSITPFTRFFNSHGLHLFDVQRIATKGGSFRGFVQKTGGPQRERPVIKQMMEEEERRGVHKPETWREYEARILERKASLIDFIDKARKEGKSVAAYGASTTVTTLIHQFELTRRIDYLIDDNPLKQGLFSPGAHLEVRPSSVLYEEPPDIVAVLAWQYAKPIIAKNARYVEEGGCFVVPLPELRTVERADAAPKSE